MSQPAMSATTAVDHLLLGVADLDAGIDWVEQRTGVRAVVGGVHPGRGTRNALLALSGRQYFEILAPDPAQEGGGRADLRALGEPRLITWSALATDIDGLAARVKAAGLSAMGPRPGSRARPDGRLLEWTTLGIEIGVRVRRDRPDPVLHPVGTGLAPPVAGFPEGLRAGVAGVRAPGAGSPARHAVAHRHRCDDPPGRDPRARRHADDAEGQAGAQVERGRCAMQSSTPSIGLRR
jgi:hypothetical protein